MMDHPNIISLYDSFEENGVLMIEMEYADGGSVHIASTICVIMICLPCLQYSGTVYTQAREAAS